MFDMLAGRLELFPMLILFHPAIWKELLKTKVFQKLRKNREKFRNRKNIFAKAIDKREK
jgi:trk system potassium uptake protein TrkH